MKHLAPSLRHKEYRIYFIGQIVNWFGTWIQQAAMGWWAYRLSGSITWLAAVGVCAQLPILFLGPFAASMADHVERKKAVMATQSLALLQSLALWGLFCSGKGEMWHIIILSLFLGTINTFDIPIRQSYASHLLPQEDLKNALAVSSLFSNFTRLIAPAVGGFIISLSGEGTCFAINCVSFLFILFALSRLSPQYSHEKNLLTSSGWKSFTLGFSYAKENSRILFGLSFAFCISLFATPYLTLMPAIAKTSFGVGPKEFGFAMGASGVGAMLAGLLQTTRPEVMRPRFIPWFCILGSVSMILMTNMPNIHWAIPFLVFIGLGLSASCSSLNLMVQLNSEPHMRGRILGLFSMCLYGAAPLGMIGLGFIAECTNPRFAIRLGGALCLIGCLFLTYQMRQSKLRQSKLQRAPINTPKPFLRD